MEERAASATAVLVCQGRAIADGRFAVGAFRDSLARELLDPAERGVVDRVRLEQAPISARERMRYDLLRRAALTVAARTVAIDAVVRDHGASQVVILGAGLDTRAWRMPELARVKVFEVDHPASQQDKMRRIGGRSPLALSVAPVEVDLASEPLAPALAGAGFDRESPSTWVWEGVVPYLSSTEVRSAAAQVAALSAPGSRLVVNYQSKSVKVVVLRGVSHLVLRLTHQVDPLAAEPWRSLWRPDEIAALLAQYGLEVVSDHDLLTLAAGLALPSAETGSLRNGRVATAVRH